MPNFFDTGVISLSSTGSLANRLDSLKVTAQTLSAGSTIQESHAIQLGSGTAVAWIRVG